MFIKKTLKFTGLLFIFEFIYWFITGCFQFMFSDLCDSLILLLNRLFPLTITQLILVSATTLITALILYLIAKKYISIKYLFKIILAHFIILFLFCCFILGIIFISSINSGSLL